MSISKAKKLNIAPDGYTTVTPWIISPSSVKLMEFLKAAFDAKLDFPDRLLLIR